MTDNNVEIAMRVSGRTIVANIILAAFKLLAGFVGHSAAMLSDAVHSLSDVLGTAIVVVGIRLANKKEDKDHPYGHERLESVAAIILAGLLFATGIGIGYRGSKTVFAGNYGSIVIPGTIALIMAAVSIAVKEAMYWYTRAAALKINSSALMADAWHQRSDALSSVGGFLGIWGARVGFPVLDAAVSVIISLFIAKASIDIFLDAIGKMTDRASDDETEEEIRKVAMAQDGVRGVDQLKTRVFGDKIYVDIEISVDSETPLYDSHDISHKVRDAIENRFPRVKHCMVHVNPHIDKKKPERD